MRLILAIFLLLPIHVHASDLALQINVLSRHAGDCSPNPCNERNGGLGLQYSWEQTHARTAYVSAGTLINSVRDRTWYAGGGWLWGEKIRAGIFIGALTYPSFRREPTPAVLPMLAIETRHVGINLIWIPPVTDQVISAALLQLKINL